jgi:hypothetical protein
LEEVKRVRGIPVASSTTELSEPAPVKPIEAVSDSTRNKSKSPNDGSRAEDAHALTELTSSSELSIANETLPSGERFPTQRQGPLFLCYRREDTQDAAGRLHDRLVAAFGASRVFMDIDSVPLGIDFVDHVKEQISGCRAVIVMIGRQWLTITDKRGNRRLDDPEDLVRVEIAAALTQKVPVIPVLVQNATMPDRNDLPDDLRPLARRNGIALRHDQWREGVARLLKELNPVMEKKR